MTNAQVKKFISSVNSTGYRYEGGSIYKKMNFMQIKVAEVDFGQDVPVFTFFPSTDELVKSAIQTLELIAEVALREK